MGLQDFLKGRVDVKSMADKIAEKESSKSFSKKWDCGYFPNRNEDGSADVIIRFLPDKEGGLPYRTRYSHNFKGDDGRWIFLDVCPTTNGENCICCQTNSKIWATGDPAKQDIVRKRSRKKNFMFNIVVINDKKNPENNGKVFFYQCGPSIFNMIMKAMKPAYDDEEPINPFDLFEGYNFRLRMRKDMSKGGMITYEDSRFESKPTALFDGDEKKLEEVFNAMVDLDEFLKPEEWQLNQDWETKIRNAYSSFDIDIDTESKPKNKRVKEEKERRNEDSIDWDNDIKATPKSDKKNEPSSGSEDEDDDLTFLKNLVNE